MRILNNIPAMNAYNNLSSVNSALRKSINRLSLGLRISSAADDASGLAVSEKMRSQIRGLDQSTRNSQDGISMIQTADGALNESSSILQRMRELSLQAANDTLTANDRGYIQVEIEQLKKEIDRISSTTQFNKKKLLNGSADVLWSSDQLSTRAIVRGGIESDDARNYKISVNNLDTGQAEIQKSNIMREKYVSYISPPNIIQTPPGGTNMAIAPVTSTNDLITALFGGNEDEMGVKIHGISANSTVAANNFASVGVFSGMGDFGLDTGIILSTGTAANFIGNNTVQDDTSLGTGVAGDADLLAISGNTINDVSRLEFDIEVDEKTTALMFEYVFSSDEYREFVNGNVNDAFGFFVNGQNVALVPGSGDPVTINTVNHASNSNFYLDNPPSTGTFNTKMDGLTVVLTAVIAVEPSSINTIKLAIADGGDARYDSNVLLKMKRLTSTWEYSEKPASYSATVGEIVNIETPDFPATITAVQGDGKVASVTIYKDDTMQDIEKKLNNLVGEGLGQAKYIENFSNSFATYAENSPNKIVNMIPEVCPVCDGSGADAANPIGVCVLCNSTGNVFGMNINYEYPEKHGFESVAGTFVIRSAIPGAAGKIHFLGDENLLKALGLNTIQEARESTFSVSVSDAHSGRPIANNIKVTGNTAHGIFHSSIDVVFDPLADMSVMWNEGMKKFDFTAKGISYETFLHLAENSTILQIGANEKESMKLSFGDVSSFSLGIGNLLVGTRELAARAVTQVDNAMSKVLSLRARLGAYQNRLELTAVNLESAMINLTASESRIRDLDMAKEMMKFTKLNILSQSAQSMLGQANQLPQAVLTLLR